MQQLARSSSFSSCGTIELVTLCGMLLAKVHWLNWVNCRVIKSNRNKDGIILVLCLLNIYVFLKIFSHFCTVSGSRRKLWKWLLNFQFYFTFHGHSRHSSSTSGHWTRRANTLDFVARHRIIPQQNVITLFVFGFPPKKPQQQRQRRLRAAAT